MAQRWWRTWEDTPLPRTKVKILPDPSTLSNAEILDELLHSADQGMYMPKDLRNEIDQTTLEIIHAQGNSPLWVRHARIKAIAGMIHRLHSQLQSNRDLASHVHLIETIDYLKYERKWTMDELRGEIAHRQDEKTMKETCAKGGVFMNIHALALEYDAMTWYMGLEEEFHSRRVPGRSGHAPYNASVRRYMLRNHRALFGPDGRVKRAEKANVTDQPKP
ncbi:hypothetical protein P152DRAFT_459049 [Eremomyces bilateralis CBS 781.70]|uniref:Uncharacterized protein n=1 Tax=Eremomyces bilateralis CBS 781.70 TaxID=1392243 RepID=A0A6G1G279_9PEZI|nr:uncharacterized protein P152DRAFT_459049 [Eremomyces bilateralis CBS 781.70]KAF1812092.1 hypothetical protein P152DRAFT_459049 [Eremomyces bilateralis CBS 781.70]